jgi:hypothetical protein
MSIIQKLKNEGVLKLYHDYRSRDVTDKSGNSNDGVMTDTQWTNEGLQFNSTTDKVAVADSVELQLTEGTIIVFGNLQNSSSTSQFVSKVDVGGVNYDFGCASTPRLQFYDGSNVRTLGTSLDGKKYSAVNFKSGETPEGFVDGVSVGSFSGSVTVTTDDAPINIGNYAIVARNLGMVLKAVLIINRKLTATEHAQLYGELSNFSAPTSVIDYVQRPLGVDPNESGLAAGYNMRPIGNTLPDISSGGNDGTISGAIHRSTPLGGSLYFDGDDYVDLGTGVAGASATVPNLTISTWIKPSAVGSYNRRIVSKYTGSGSTAGTIILDIASGASVRFFVAKSGGGLENAASTGKISANLPYHIVSRYTAGEMEIFINGEKDGTFTASDTAIPAYNYKWTLGDDGAYAGTQTFQGDMFNKLEVVEESWSDAKILQEYNKGKQALTQMGYGANESDSNITAGFLENTPFEVSTGSHKISTDTINGKNVKCIETVNSGIYYMPVCRLHNCAGEEAYGEWKFWVNKANGSSFIFQMFADDITVAGSSNNTNVFYQNDETVVSRDKTTIRINSSPTTFAHSTWHEFKVTRKYDDEWELFVNSTSYGTFTSATYTSGEWLVVDADSGDKLAIESDQGDALFYKSYLA